MKKFWFGKREVGNTTPPPHSLSQINVLVTALLVAYDLENQVDANGKKCLEPEKALSFQFFASHVVSSSEAVVPIYKHPSYVICSLSPFRN